MSRASDAEVREWLDRLAIQDLIHRYSDAVTRADYEQMATVFASDAVWESPLLGMRYEQASDFIAMQIEGNDSLDVLIQTAHNPVITLDASDMAHATTTIHERIRGIAGEVGDGLLGRVGSGLERGPVRDSTSRVLADLRCTRKSTIGASCPFLIGSGTVAGGSVVDNPPTDCARTGWLSGPRPAAIR